MHKQTNVATVHIQTTGLETSSRRRFLALKHLRFANCFELSSLPHPLSHSQNNIELRSMLIIIFRNLRITALAYRVESSHPMMGPLLPINGSKFFRLMDRTLAVVVAAKSMTKPFGHEIRVVHVPTGQVVFRKTDAHLSPSSDDF
jgi:hypothetical protein